jgi:hypothetical protein
MKGRKGRWNQHITDMISVKKYGDYLSLCYQAGVVNGVESLKTIEGLSMRFSGSYEQGLLGATCHQIMENGVAFISGSFVGVGEEYGKGFLKFLSKILTMNG